MAAGAVFMSSGILTKKRAVEQLKRLVLVVIYAIRSIKSWNLLEDESKDL